MIINGHRLWRRLLRDTQLRLDGFVTGLPVDRLRAEQRVLHYQIDTRRTRSMVDRLSALDHFLLHQWIERTLYTPGTPVPGTFPIYSDWLLSAEQMGERGLFGTLWRRGSGRRRADRLLTVPMQIFGAAGVGADGHALWHRLHAELHAPMLATTATGTFAPGPRHHAWIASGPGPGVLVETRYETRSLELIRQVGWYWTEACRRDLQ